MGCNCGGGGSALANYEVKNDKGETVKVFTAVNETEVKAFVARTPGTNWRKTS